MSGCSKEGQRSGIEKQNVIGSDDVEGQTSGAANRIDGTDDAEQKLLSEDKGLMENGIIGEIIRYERIRSTVQQKSKQLFFCTSNY